MCPKGVWKLISSLCSNPIISIWRSDESNCCRFLIDNLNNSKTFIEQFNIPFNAIAMANFSKAPPGVQTDIHVINFAVGSQTRRLPSTQQHIMGAVCRLIYSTAPLDAHLIHIYNKYVRNTMLESLSGRAAFWWRRECKFALRRDNLAAARNLGADLA